MENWIHALIVFFVIGHISSVCFTIYVHRGAGHHYFKFTPILSHFFRFWLWFAVGMCHDNWLQRYAAKHRKHHKYSDTADDPHSPFFYTFTQLFDISHCDPKKANYISNEEVILYAPDITTPNDWLENNIYNKYNNLGLYILWTLLTVQFGILGFILGAINRFFIVKFFIFFGNYAFHKIGFSYPHKHNKPLHDKSKILFPWGLFSAGEELHANHHINPYNPFFNNRWFEIDLGAIYCKILIKLRLMSIISPLKY